MSIGKNIKTNTLKQEILNLETRLREEQDRLRTLEYNIAQQKIRVSRTQDQITRKKRELIYSKDKKRKSLL